VATFDLATSNRRANKVQERFESGCSDGGILEDGKALHGGLAYYGKVVNEEELSHSPCKV